MTRLFTIILVVFSFFIASLGTSEARTLGGNQAAPAGGEASALTAGQQSPTIDELKKEIDALKQQLEQVPALQERILELEKKLSAMVEEAELEAARLEKDNRKRLTAYYRDGFFLATADETFRLQIGGVLHFDTRVFGGGDQATPGGFDIRRGRYDLRGTLYGADLEHQFRLQIEMADTPYLRNAYWTFRFSPTFALQLGQFKAPTGGADWMTEEAQINFIEYSIHPPVTPFFDRGFNTHWSFANRRVQANLALVTGVGSDFEVPQGDLDNHKDVAARVMLAPWMGATGSALEGLRVAGSFEQGLASIRARQGGETGYRTENYQSRWYEWKPATMDLERRTRYGWEAHLIRGPLTVSYEWSRVEWDHITSYTAGVGSLPGRAHADVGQIWVSYFLTGEQKTLDDVFFAWRQPKPRKILSIKERTFGAWELVAKYSFKSASEELFELGILDGSRKGYAVTGGLRWIWNPKVRIMVDVNHLKSTEGKGIVVEYADLGTLQKRYVDHENAVLVRFILSL